MKIVDAFIFYNELKMLEFRLKTLYEHVDHFVIVEATHTHKGNKKELYFEKNKEKFEQYADKITHIIVDDMPNDNKNPWINENHHRRCITRGLVKLKLNDEDIVSICDADEIPDPLIFRKIKKQELIISSFISLQQDMYYYNFKCRQIEKWLKSKITSFRFCKSNDIEQIRHLRDNIVEKGGWHLSNFGDVSFIKNKIMNYAHQEFNNHKYLKKIEKRMHNGEDVFGRSSNPFEKIEIKDNDYLPEHYKMLL